MINFGNLMMHLSYPQFFTVSFCVCFLHFSAPLFGFERLGSTVARFTRNAKKIWPPSGVGTTHEQAIIAIWRFTTTITWRPTIIRRKHTQSGQIIPWLDDISGHTAGGCNDVFCPRNTLPIEMDKKILSFGIVTVPFAHEISTLSKFSVLPFTLQKAVFSKFGVLPFTV